MARVTVRTFIRAVNGQSGSEHDLESVPMPTYSIKGGDHRITVVGAHKPGSRQRLAHGGTDKKAGLSPLLLCCSLRRTAAFRQHLRVLTIVRCV